jgi:hypothetical protein
VSLFVCLFLFCFVLFCFFFFFFLSSFSSFFSPFLQMGNAHVTNVKRMGVRSGPGAETRWVELGDGYEFNPSDGIAPAQLVAELHVDKTIKLENTRFQWVAEDTFAAPIDFVLAETSVPLVMETLTTYCSLPRAWPSGQYRVDVFLGSSSESDGSLKFRIRETDHQMANATLTRTSDGSVVEDTIQRGDGPLRIVFESGFMCHVRKVEWELLFWYCLLKTTTGIIH